MRWAPGSDRLSVCSPTQGLSWKWHLWQICILNGLGKDIYTTGNTDYTPWRINSHVLIPAKSRLKWSGRGRHWNFDPLQCLRPRPEILDRYISLSCLRWLPTACHERLVYFHWPQWVTWLVTWWVTWSRWPNAGRHIGKFSLWTTLLWFSRSAQISLFSNFTKLGQLFFDNIFFGLTS